MSESKDGGVKRPTISLPASMDEEIEDRLDYGDSKSAFIREAVREKLERDRDESNATEQPER